MKLNEIKPLFEGGNIFKDENKKPVTVRINKADVDPTLKWLEKIVKLPLIDNKLGSTGIRSTSGDLDIAVDQSKISKDELVKKLKKWTDKYGLDSREWIRKSGISVHFKTPIRGDWPTDDPTFVQTDLMFGDPDWMKFSLQGSGDDTPYKGVHRQLLLASIAKANGLKWSSAAGLTSRESGDLISKDPDRIAEVLLGDGRTAKDLTTVESIIKAIKGHPEYNELVADAKAAFAKDNLKLP